MSQENLALDLKQQSSFDASVKNLRKTLEDSDEKSVHKFKGNGRGVVFLSRIPYGFFENEIRKYFRQFGKVTRVRVARSRKTGNSKGFAYIEFEYPEVAQVAAETMNNYLMFSKILKAKYIPPEEQKYDYFRGVMEGKVPKDRNRKKHIELFNRSLSSIEKKLYCKRADYKLMRKLKKLQALGIEYECKSVIKTKSAEPRKCVLTIDESDDEITFKIPRNVSIVRRKATSTGNKEAVSKEENTVKQISRKSSIGDFRVTESSSISKKSENKEHMKGEKASDKLQDNVSNRNLGMEGKSQSSLKNKDIRKKSNVTESPCVESPNLKNTPKRRKSIKSASSGWQVDDCS